MRFDERPRLLLLPDDELRPPPLVPCERPLLRLRERELPPPLREFFCLFDVGIEILPG